MPWRPLGKQRMRCCAYPNGCDYRENKGNSAHQAGARHIFLLWGDSRLRCTVPIYSFLLFTRQLAPHRNHVGRIERAERTITFDRVLRLAHALQVQPQELWKLLPIPKRLPRKKKKRQE